MPHAPPIDVPPVIEQTEETNEDSKAQDNEPSPTSGSNVEQNVAQPEDNPDEEKKEQTIEKQDEH